MRFLHIADVHLDTGFAARSSTVRNRLRQASRDALERCVDTALQERVDALLIAGDLFDGEHVSFATERFLLDQLARLDQAGVAVVYATGNHDPESAVRSGHLAWPGNTTVVAEEKPQTVAVAGRDGKPVGWVTAAGHATVGVEADLSQAMRPRPGTPLPQVAMLHTQVSSVAARAHGPYAPSNVDYLRQAGFHYWALGHVHQRQAVSSDDDPPIRYPGNLQGRNPHETGPKGGLLVDVSDPRRPQVEFRAFAPVRWQKLMVSALEDVRTLDQLVKRVVRRWKEFRAEEPAESDAEWMTVVELTGPAALWRKLREPEEAEYLAEELTRKLGFLYAEVRTAAVRPLVRVDEHEGRPDVLGAVLELAKEVAAGDSGRLGLGPADFRGFDPNRHGALDAYLARLLKGGEEEIVSKMLKDEDGRP